MDLATIEAAPVPAHVPPELVRDFQLWNVPGVDLDPVQATVDAARAAPDIFYALRVRKDGESAWVVGAHELVREIFQDPQLFSNKARANVSALLEESWDLLPLEVDPPEHDKWRLLMNPVFSPRRMKAVEEDIKTTARRLVDAALAKGETEFVADFSREFPVTIFLSLMGLPLDHAPRFVEWANGMLHETSLETRMRSAGLIRDYLVDIIAARRQAPTDDLMSYVLTTPVDGRAITDQEALAVCFLLFVAGLDTVAGTLGLIFKHLAENPSHQMRLRADPALVPAAVEEYLRAFPVVISSRLVTRDVEFHGVAMKAGDRIVLPIMLAGRDAREFPKPDEIDFDREKVAHITFAAGPHRCIGSHLARRELVIALGEWLTRAPPFRLKPGETSVTHAIGSYGVDYLPLVW
jgi:cytochrome P450